jgi:hypothetical protein
MEDELWSAAFRGASRDGRVQYCWETTRRAKIAQQKAKLAKHISRS